jgi:alkanesulfonate monooxygenase SsuD/methylene tetrahydromethanopterin reductase-like flavin-dependent oxidoreductase (luciferase family)
MDIGFGLPSAVPGAAAGSVVDGARRAELRGFASLGVLDRLCYDSFDSIAVLAAAAAVTSSVRLTASTVVPVYRGSVAVLGKQLASVAALAGDRLVLGIGAGGRAEDFKAAGVDYHRRGRLLEQLLPELQAGWSDFTAGGPRPAAVPPIVLGGRAPKTFERVARYADGWIAAGASAGLFAPAAAEVVRSWERYGRAGAPRLMSIGYYALGPDADDVARRYLMDYYAFLGPAAKMLAAGALTSEEAVRRTCREMADAGCQELLLLPCSADADQVDRLADTVF